MIKIKSLEDLKKYQQEVIKAKKRKADQGAITISVGLGSCGIAAGAHHTYEAIMQQLESQDPNRISLIKTGCIGLCKHEPIVNVIIGNEPMVTYGHVTPELASRIVEEHILQGRIIEEYVIESIPFPTI